MKLSNYIRVLASAALFALLPAGAWAALTTYETEIMKNRSIPVAFVSVRDVPQGTWTNANPPVVPLRIRYVFRDKLPSTIDGKWKPMPVDFSWAGVGAAEKLMKEWGDKPLVPPDKDSKWYVALQKVGENDYEISPVLRYPASNEISKEIGQLDSEYFNNKPASVQSYDEIEMTAARAARLTLWYDTLKGADVRQLQDKADLVALVNVGAMDPVPRQVQFNIQSIVKAPTSVDKPETIKLAGFPNELYASMYDYSKMPGVPPLLVFMKQKTIPSPNGTQQVAFAPVDSKLSILPADNERKSALNIKEK